MFSGVRNGAIVVAHPDDESLWCGGLMARFPARWTAICCSIPRRDPIRAWKFFDACAVLGASARLLPFVEPDPGSWISAVQSVDLSGYDTIVTHNSVGEYGHLHHVQVHQHIAQHWPRKMVTIGYGQPGTYRIELTGPEMQRKFDAIRCYNHVSPSDGKPKWEALFERYGTMFDLSVETYDFYRT